MIDNNLSEDQRFVVKESQTSNFIFAGIYLLMFYTAIESDVIDFSKHTKISFIAISILLIPGIVLLYKASQRNAIIEINNKGITYYGKLITNWENYVKSYYTQEGADGGLTDDFVLMIEYYKPAFGTNYISKIPLTNTQDKSPEEIISAIQKCYDNKIKASAAIE